MYEYEELEDLDNPAQGDVIEWFGEHSKRPWKRFGIIITADCDLARDKHGGVISYVPALTSEDFIWQTWRKNRFSRAAEDNLVKAGQRIQKWLLSRGKSQSELSAVAMRQWLARATPNAILDEIGVENPGERANLLNSLEPAATILELLDKQEPCMATLRRAYAVVNSRYSEDKSLMALDVQKTWTNLPGDLFHLTTMPSDNPKQNAGPDIKNDGIFLQLRHIWQVNSDEVSTRPLDFKDGKAKVRRICRVGAPYRYAITQSLARVFSDIGLPDEYDSRRKSAASSFLSEGESE